MSGKTKQLHYQSIDKALAYIHENLEHDLSLEILSEKACYSKYHFCRVFMLHVGESPLSYIRKQRLNAAAKDLVDSNKNLLTIALTYGFESQATFSRAFKAEYNTSPNAFRKAKKHNSEQANFRQHITSDTDGIITGELVNITEVKLAGMHTQTSFNDNKIPELWQKFMPRVKEFNNISKPDFYYAVHPYESHLNIDDFNESIAVKRWSCVPVNDFHKLPKDMETHLLKAGKYLKYTYKGRAQDIFPFVKALYTQWVPKSGYTLDERDDFEIIDSSRYFGPHHPESEVDLFIPVK